MKKIFYGGDARKINQIGAGDVMYVELLDNAITELLAEAYLTKSRINVTLTDVQLMQIHPKREELTAMIYFIPIKTYHSDKRIQKAIITCNEKIIKIYTAKE